MATGEYEQFLHGSQAFVQIFSKRSHFSKAIGHARMQEFCNGGALNRAINAGVFRRGGSKNRWNAVISVLKGIANGMHYIHQMRICHGDLNPANILLHVRPPLHCC
jgi:serine/threonine protein kinase